MIRTARLEGRGWSDESGGITDTFPFEIWWYRYVEGVGRDFEIKFVDSSGTGEYRMVTGPDILFNLHCKVEKCL